MLKVEKKDGEQAGGQQMKIKLKERNPDKKAKLNELEDATNKQLLAKMDELLTFLRDDSAESILGLLQQINSSLRPGQTAWEQEAEYEFAPELYAGGKKPAPKK